MFKKLYKKFVGNRKRKQEKASGNITKLNSALNPEKDIQIVYEEINEYVIKGVMYKLGDRVICRSNECDPLTVGTIIEFWDNGGKWSSCIPHIKDDLDGQVLGIMGTVVHHTEELMNILKPMRMLEQWNYLLPDNVKEYSYTEEQMVKKEKQYIKRQKMKNSLVS